MNKKGFTLVEVLVVITIIGILAIIVLPNFVNNFKESKNRAMITQENEIVDASKLFVEDFCRHPLMEHKTECGVYSLNTSVTNQKYICLKSLQAFKYIDDIMFDGSNCIGFVTYMSDYSDYKAYLQCGTGYETQNASNIKNSSGTKIISLCR